MKTRLRVIARLIAISAPPWGRLAAAAALGLAGAGATIGLLAGSGYVVDRAAFRPGLGAIAGVLAAVEVLAFSRAPLRYAERLVGHDAAFRALSSWRVWLFDRLEPLSPGALRAWRSGDLLTRAIEDVDNLQDLYLRGLTPLIVAMATSTLAVVVVSILLPWAGLLLGVFLLIALIAQPVIAMGNPQGNTPEAALKGELGADIVDLLQGAPDLLAFGREQDLLARIEATEEALASIGKSRALRVGIANAIATVCLGAGVLSVLLVGVTALAHHHLEPVMIAVLPLTAIGAFEALVPLAQVGLGFRNVLESGSRLLALADLTPPVIDAADLLAMPPGCPSLSVEDACLRYGDDQPWALDEAELAVDSGARVAVVGPSGSGKSSLIHLLLRFWPLQSGSVSLGGIPHASLAQREVRATMALVDQEATLFAGSIRDNVTLARPNATETEIESAVRAAQLSEWIALLPEGLDTEVGEHGTQVSGGQQRRIALARALLVDAPILLLDEPTAGLDDETADRLLADLLASTEGKSLLLVTHRQADLTSFEEVVVLERGRTTRVAD